MFILSSSPFSVLRPSKSRQSQKPLDWQYHIRVGEYPKIKLYIASPFQYSTPDQARYFAERECKRRGLDIMRVLIYTIRKGKKL